MVSAFDATNFRLKRKKISQIANWQMERKAEERPVADFRSFNFRIWLGAELRRNILIRCGKRVTAQFTHSSDFLNGKFVAMRWISSDCNDSVVCFSAMCVHCFI